MAKPKVEDVSQEIVEIFKVDDITRRVLDRTMFRNLLYYLGEQWLDWFESTSTFGRRYEINPGVPTPVSNIIRDTVKSMKALTERFDVYYKSLKEKKGDVSGLELS